MQKRSALFCSLALSLVAACGGGGGDDGNSTPDATPGGFPDGNSNPLADARPSVDASPLPDATPSSLACIGDTLPTTVASPPIVISGVVQEGSQNGVQTMDQSAHVAAHLVADDGILVEGDFTGAFSVTDPDDSTTPIDAYLKSTSQGYVDTYVYPPYPIFESLDNTPIIMVSNDIYGFLPLLVGVNQDAGNGVLIIAVVDCDQASVEGATVNITPNVGTIKYAGSSGIPSTTNYPSTQSSGVAYIFNVPPGKYSIGASKGGMDLRDNAVTAYADSNTTLVVAP